MNNKKLISAIAALAAASAPLASLAADEVTVTLDGKELEFDVPAQIIEERTMVPLRVIFESLGAAVDWDGDTQTVTSVKGDTTIKMTIGEYAININGETTELDVAPLILDDRTLVPARAVAEGFGALVDWDGDTRTVIITSAEPAAPADGEEPPAKPEGEDIKPADSEEPPAKPEGEIPAEKPSEAPAKPSADITIDTSSDLFSETINGFKIEEISKNADGNYEITYSFYTFLEGSGSVTAAFNCLDADGKVVDSFSGSYKTIDYTQTPQKDSAVISGKTVKIVLAK